MNVLLINGSPHPKGSTYTALSAVADGLTAEGISCSIKQVGHLAIRGCMACGKCQEIGQCIINDDPVNEYSSLIRAADGLVIGSPVYYAAPNGALCAFLDRLFMSSGPTAFAFKPGASVVSCRRGGASAAFDRLNKYFTISSMPIVSSVYWNSVHGNMAEETVQDLEGIHVMRVLGQNMAWLLKCIDTAKSTVPYPVQGPKVYTNFIR
ncbi:flavodoxin family protein [Desulfosarcina sp. OttesenSCG-928-A07]|nr:flavodoxin family protein [Desulfosarcina sp. OttesenSCG-928-G17]MDL2329487.1 flavodoxin family protein [Desulfosarcina sp. OttesenSCG-928-A07]